MASDQQVEFKRNFEKNLEKSNGDIKTAIKTAIDLNYFAPIIRWNWRNVFEREFEKRTKNNVRSATELITEARNRSSHRDGEDIASEDTRVYLFHIAKVLGYINASDGKQKEVEDIRNQLFSDEAEGHVADVSDQLETAKAEKTELEKQLKDKSDRLAEVEAEWLVCDERLETMSTELEIAEAGKIVAEEPLSDISNRFEEAEVENAELKKCLSETENRLRTVESEKDELAECLEIRSTELEDVKAELDACKENKVPEPLSPNPNPPDSVTFQGTIFTKYLNEYHATEDDISQSFWHYWHSQGREGKQKMRDAGWSVEEVDEEWEVIVSPEDFQAWIVREVRKLNNVFNSSQNEEPATRASRSFDGRTVLPTSKEMEQPALKVLADKKEHRRVEIIDYLTEYFSLTDDERRYLSKTGQAEKHMMSKGLIERTRTGYYRITAYVVFTFS